jgi:hypothetical protein
VAIDHENVLRIVQETLTQLREKFLIPARWRISIYIKCPNEMPQALGSMSWSYLPNAQYFLSLRCDIPTYLIEWIIAHELLEAMMAPYADLAENHIEKISSKSLKGILHTQHGDVRNEIIEWVLPLILGYTRPE